MNFFLWQCNLGQCVTVTSTNRDVWVNDVLNARKKHNNLRHARKIIFFLFSAPDDGKEGRIVLVGVKAATLGHRSRGREKEVAGGGEGCVALLRIAKKGGERERKSWQWGRFQRYGVERRKRKRREAVATHTQDPGLNTRENSENLLSPPRPLFFSQLFVSFFLSSFFSLSIPLSLSFVRKRFGIQYHTVTSMKEREI